jgi:hypothetical protein
MIIRKSAQEIELMAAAGVVVAGAVAGCGLTGADSPAQFPGASGRRIT